jgi:hypothetical protein
MQNDPILCRLVFVLRRSGVGSHNVSKSRRVAIIRNQHALYIIAVLGCSMNIFYGLKATAVWPEHMMGLTLKPRDKYPVDHVFIAAIGTFILTWLTYSSRDHVRIKPCCFPFERDKDKISQSRQGRRKTSKQRKPEEMGTPCAQSARERKRQQAAMRTELNNVAPSGSPKQLSSSVTMGPLLAKWIAGGPRPDVQDLVDELVASKSLANKNEPETLNRDRLLRKQHFVALQSGAAGSRRIPRAHKNNSSQGLSPPDEGSPLMITQGEEIKRLSLPISKRHSRTLNPSREQSLKDSQNERSFKS